jgi:hypothetical protein
VVLDTLVGQTRGAKNHAAAAIKLGLTLHERAEASLKC